MDRNYLLSITEFLEGENSRKLLKEALSKVDSERRSKAERMRTDGGRAACLGAGLLLQLAVQEAIGGCEPEEKCHYQGVRPTRKVVEGSCNDTHLSVGYGTEGRGQLQAGQGAKCRLHRYSVSRLLERISSPVYLEYRYGKNGKPYFREYPFYFNLSHSGEYVFCALSSGEVGADIQQYRNIGNGRLAERFFAPQEIAALRGCGEGENPLFFQLWTRKEAYGKLTGEGIVSTVGLNFLSGAEQVVGGRKLVWEEYDEIAGYQLAVCRYAA